MWKDCETNIDYLNINHVINVLNEIIMDDSLTPATIGVYGDWGSGKSSILSMSENILSQNKDVLCIRFNSWLFEDYYDTRLALVGTIIDKIIATAKENKTIKDKVVTMFRSLKLLNIAKKGLGYLLDLAVNKGERTKEAALNFLLGNSDEVSNSLEQDEYGLRENIKTFCDDFKTILKEAKLKRLIVYIDELDRCNPAKIVDILEAIRLFIFVDGASFIIGADQRMIEFAVQQKYNGIEGKNTPIGKEYLDKLVQYAVNIPLLNKTEMFNYICYLYIEKSDIKNKQVIIDDAIKLMNSDINFKFNIDFFIEEKEDVQSKLINVFSIAETLSIIFDQGFQGNPRKCKRFLNIMSMRLNIAKFRSLSLDIGVLSKLMMLEYYKTNIYEIVIKEQVKNGGKVPLLKRFEETITEEDPFQAHRDDKWFWIWLNSSPEINDVDLQPYIYVSREKSVYDYNTIGLSTFAESIYNNLTCGSDIKFAFAIKAIKKLDKEEALSLFNRLNQKYISETINPSMYFKPLIALATNIEIFKIRMIEIINRISKIKLNDIPLINKFAEIYSCKIELKSYYEILESDPKFKKMQETLTRRK